MEYTTPSLISELNAAGLTLTLMPDARIKAAPAERLTDELRHLIRTHKDQLLQWLERQPANDYREGPIGSDWWCWPSLQELDAPMNPGEIEVFTARVLLFLRRGFPASSADRLADALKRRDREADTRRCCLECQHLSSRHTCTAYRQAGLDSPSLPKELLTCLQRCTGWGKVL